MNEYMPVGTHVLLNGRTDLTVTTSLSTPKTSTPDSAAPPPPGSAHCGSGSWRSYMTSEVTAEAAYVELPSLPLGVEVSEKGLMSGTKTSPEGLSARALRLPESPQLGKSPGTVRLALAYPLVSSGYKKGARQKPPPLSNEGFRGSRKRGCGSGGRDSGSEGSDVR